MVFLFIICIIYYMLLDELMMSSVQKSMGPYNIGWYSILSSMINGCNLIKTQCVIPKNAFHFGYQSFPMMFFLFSLCNTDMIYPFFIMNLMLSIVMLIMFSAMSMLFMILSGISGSSKYSMLGCMSIIAQLMSFELMWSTMLMIFIWSFNEVSIVVFIM